MWVAVAQDLVDLLGAGVDHLAETADSCFELEVSLKSIKSVSIIFLVSKFTTKNVSTHLGIFALGHASCMPWWQYSHTRSLGGSFSLWCWDGFVQRDACSCLRSRRTLRSHEAEESQWSKDLEAQSFAYKISTKLNCCLCLSERV